jgi:hypothetical protein
MMKILKLGFINSLTMCLEVLLDLLEKDEPKNPPKLRIVKLE